jgi:UDP-N-acetyl-D-mannosaminuronate dehydrogenase
MGEVGRPLFQILSRRFECAAIDIEAVELNGPCSVLHVCYPFQVPDFVGITAGYVEKYRPALTIINSTIAPGTTRKVEQRVREGAIAYSPVRGKHAKMESDMLRYKKFVAARHPDALNRAVNHFAEAGFKTATFPSPELAELAKLLETTYLGILIAWAQEVERLAAQYGGSFEDVNAFVEEVDFLPQVYPGRIGGHCVMPNIAILRSQLKSKFLDLVVESNQAKEQELLARAATELK